MFEQLRKNIGLQLAKFHFRKHKENLVQFTNVISTARKALIILPQSQREFFVASIVLQALAQKLECVLVAKTEQSNKVKDQFAVINIEPTEINRFFLPRKSLIQKILREEYDLAIDLNLRFHLTAAYLCKKARSKIKAGFLKDYADTFYNFQVRVSEPQDAQLAYERMVACLQMF
jgi:ADP-heptose:LPS heptosyltransferase